MSKKKQKRPYVRRKMSGEEVQELLKLHHRASSARYTKDQTRGEKRRKAIEDAGI